MNTTPATFYILSRKLLQPEHNYKHSLTVLTFNDIWLQYISRLPWLWTKSDRTLSWRLLRRRSYKTNSFSSSVNVQLGVTTCKPQDILSTRLRSIRLDHDCWSSRVNLIIFSNTSFGRSYNTVIDCMSTKHSIHQCRLSLMTFPQAYTYSIGKGQ